MSAVRNVALFSGWLGIVAGIEDVILPVGVFLFTIIYIIAYASSPEATRRKAYYRRVNLLVVAINVMEVSYLFFYFLLMPFTASFIRCTALQCDCSDKELSFYGEYSSFISVAAVPLTDFGVYLFIGYSATTSLFFARMVNCKSVAKGARLSRYHRSWVPLWEHAVVVSFAVIITISRMSIMVALYLSTKVLPLWITTIMGHCTSIIRNLVLVSVIVLEWLTFLTIVRAMLGGNKRRKARRPNYMALILSFVVPFTLQILVYLAVVGVLLVMIVLIIAQHVRGPSDPTTIAIILAGDAETIVMAVYIALIGVQVFTIILGNAFLLARSTLRNHRKERELRAMSYNSYTSGHATEAPPTPAEYFGVISAAPRGPPHNLTIDTIRV